MQFEKQEVRGVFQGSGSFTPSDFTFDTTTDVCEILFSVWRCKGTLEAATSKKSEGATKDPQPRADSDVFLGRLVLRIKMSLMKKGVEVLGWYGLRARVPGEKVQGEIQLGLTFTKSTTIVGVNDFEMLVVLGRGGFGKVLQVHLSLFLFTYIYFKYLIPLDLYFILYFFFFDDR